MTGYDTLRVHICNTVTRMVTRHRFLVAFVSMIISCAFLIVGTNTRMQGDVALYQKIASDWLDYDKMPYRDRVVEYPPYSIPLFALPRALGEKHYLVSFTILTIGADCLVKIILFGVGLRYTNVFRGLLPLLLYCAAVPFLRYFYLQRYDVFITLVGLLAILSFCTGQHLISGLSIAIGIGAKLYPIVFVPTLCVIAIRQHKVRPFLFGLVIGLLPIALLSFELPWWDFATFHAERGLQVESLYASVLWLGKLLGVAQLDWIRTRASFELGGALAMNIVPLARAIFVIAVTISSAISTLGAVIVPTSFRRAGGTTKYLVSIPEISRLLLIPILGFVAFNPVLSPQYMIWLLPPAGLLALTGKLRWTVAMLVATMLTPAFFPVHEYAFGLNLSQTAILLVRNLILVITWTSLVSGTIRQLRRHLAHPDRSGERSGHLASAL